MPKDRERYFQTIARRLFSLRGAPFVLSAREMETAEAWATDGIPLDTVLEGMERGYEEFRSRKGPKGRKLTLTLCHPHVQKAFSLLRDRGVGRERCIVTQEDKYREISRAVKAFLRDVPSPVSDLRKIYASIQADLTRGACDSESLEDRDAEIESLLFRMASGEDRAGMATQIAEEHGVTDQEELSRLVRIKWIKTLREKYNIPHVSPFYY